MTPIQEHAERLVPYYAARMMQKFPDLERAIREDDRPAIVVWMHAIAEEWERLASAKVRAHTPCREVPSATLAPCGGGSWPR